MTTTFESHLMTKVREVFEDISGLELEGFGSDSNYLELGLDSLLLTQAATSLKRTFEVEVSFRQLSDELDTPGALVRYLSEHMTPKARA
ncbi:MAG TPA: phosphopantetheine-binding protein, partial [Myxococcales bacterium LLY-WYZ-16_1]|nr:phosphopantetheine-binding protein [Myxococcales bacterium LLY-WYZ-16_1]